MALIQCTECNGAISDQAKACPQCGAPVVRAKPKRSWRALIALVVVVGVAGAIANMQSEQKRADSATDEARRLSALSPQQRAVEAASKLKSRNEDTARFGCKETIARSLHDRDNATFDGWQNSYAETRKDGTILVQVEVRGKNAFNATRLSMFDCVLKFKAGEWSMVSIKERHL